MKDLFEIQEQVVVITGGTGILGSEIGKYLASQGAKVVKNKSVITATDKLSLEKANIFFPKSFSDAPI